jgi:L-lactate dehydrogenase
MMDLNHSMAFVRPMRIVTGNYSDLADADVIVICAGVNQKPGQTRLELLKMNARIFQDIVPRINAVNHDAIIVVGTNPVDILTHVTARNVGVDCGRVIGSGTALDTARFRYMLGVHYGVDPRSIHAYIVGEHGDSELPLWSLANIAGVGLAEFTGINGQKYDLQALNNIFEQTRNAAYEIIKRKRSTYYAIGLGLLAIVEAILRNQHTVMTISSPLSGQYGVNDVSISMPTVIGRKGVEEVINLPVSKFEHESFLKSAQTLKDHLAEIDH